MNSQIKLGRIFGIEIGLHYSWFLIALLIASSLYAQFHHADPQWGDGVIVAMAVVTALLFFVSLLVHELAHSVFAQSHGLPVKEITLFALGGVSQIEKEPTSAKTEFWMAFAGPLTSAIIGGVCMLVRSAPLSPQLDAMVSWLGYINLALAVFNMVPGYPLDGGRILRAIIWWKTGDVNVATRRAAKTGQAVAVVFIAWGILQFAAGAGFGGLWISFIGWFLLQASSASSRQIGLQHALEGVTAGDLMSGDCPSLDANMNIQDFVNEELLRTGKRCFVVLQNGELAGLITPHEVKGIERQRWPYTTLRDVMRPLEDLHTVPPETPLKDALEIMGREDLNQVPVMKNGQLAGILSRAHVLDYLRTRAEMNA